jgi:threonine dehydratase
MTAKSTLTRRSVLRGATAMGAAALAAALFRRDQIAGDTVIVTISGGNVDADVFQRALTDYGDLT